MVGSKDTFVIKILNTQHATWQGTITWASTKETQHFRSALEMIKLIDSAIGIKDEDENKKLRFNERSEQ